MAESLRLPPRAELLNVVERVHRRNAIQELAAYGIKLAQDATWREIVDRTPDDPPYELGMSKYEGRIRVDGILGSRKVAVAISGISLQMTNEITEPKDYALAHKHCDILVYDGGLPINVKLMSDSPPVALFADDIDEIYERNPDDELLRGDNDAAIINAVRRTFGEEAVEPLSDAAAKSLIHALLNENSHIIRRPD